MMPSAPPRLLLPSVAAAVVLTVGVLFCVAPGQPPVRPAAGDKPAGSPPGPSRCAARRSGCWISARARC